MSGSFKAEYREGLEDGLELCLEEVQRSTGKKDALARIRYLLGLVKESKLNRLQELIGDPRTE